MAKVTKKQKKAFVLDTNVVLSDSNAIFNFGENDVILPMVVLEELDKFKKGTGEVNRNAREFHRVINKLLPEKLDSNKGIKLSPLSTLFFPVWKKSERKRENSFLGESNDHHLLDIALQFKDSEKYQDIVLVTSDLNLQIKAKMLGLTAEYYRSSDADLELLKQGIQPIIIPEDEVAEIQNNKTPSSETCPELFMQLSSFEGNFALAIQSKVEDEPVYYKWFKNQLQPLDKNWWIGSLSAKSPEQAFVLDALRDPSIGVVALTGPAGTGKTLLAMLSALEHLQKQNYIRVLVGRPMMEVSDKTMGFLPGNIEEKIDPYFHPIYDNLEFIRDAEIRGKSKSKKEKNPKDAQQVPVQEKAESLMAIKAWAKERGIEFFALNFLRGRSLPNQLIIVDEAQNMTPHEMKTLITRLGEGSKVIVIGDTNQIDCPYLTEKSNGLAYLIQCWYDRPEFFHLHLSKGERSTIASIAADIM